MDWFTENRKRFFYYTLYAVLVTFLLLYLRFPEDDFRKYLERNINRLYPEISFSIAKVTPWFPVGLRLSQGKVGLINEPELTIFSADSFCFGPKILSFLLGMHKYVFAIKAYGGNIGGQIHARNGPGSDIQAEAEIRGFDLGAYTYVSSLLGREVKGVMSGRISVDMAGNSLMDGFGQADMRLSNGEIELVQPILGLKSLGYNEITFDLELQDRKISLHHAEFVGRELEGSVSGMIYLEPDLLNSGVDLKGILRPSATEGEKTELQKIFSLINNGTDKDEISFTVTGTAKKPVFTIL